MRKGMLDNSMVDLEQKSEEVQVIIERMPTYWTKWIALCVSVLMGIVILLGFLIKYPDTVDGTISITGVSAPVRLVSKDNGRIMLLCKNHSKVHNGQVVAYIANGTNYHHLLLLEKLLYKVSIKKICDITMPDTLILGELSTAYNHFMLAYLQYQRLLASDIYTTMRQSIQQQIISDKSVIDNIDAELKLKQHILKSSYLQLRKDSVLLAARGISETEYQNQHTNYLNIEEANLSLLSSRQMKKSEVNRSQVEVQRIRLEEAEIKEKAYSDLLTKKNELTNAIMLWKEHYLMTAPIEGEIEYLGFWHNNHFVQAGQEMFSIIPHKNSIIGEVQIPSLGAGKVKVGQIANVKVDNFPYDEYGLLRGTVKSITRITNKLKTQHGEVDAYLVTISFPNGLTTNFGRHLPLDFESKGTTEIITKPKRLIERLFDNLKAKGEK